MNTLYVGIDVSSKSNVVYLMLPNGDKHSNFSVANSHEGSTQLVKRILSALTSHSLDTVLIGLEATSIYGYNLVYFLREDATLAPFNRKIHVLNPKQVKKFHDAYNDLPKNDYVDSFVIADCLRFRQEAFSDSSYSPIACCAKQATPCLSAAVSVFAGAPGSPMPSPLAEPSLFLVSPPPLYRVALSAIGIGSNKVCVLCVLSVALLSVCINAPLPPPSHPLLICNVIG